MRDRLQRTKPFLRWAGSKRKQLPRLAAFWSASYSRYVEPFAGSACLFFELAPPSAVLGDNNAHLIEVYRVVRDNPDRIYNRLCHIRRDSETYYRWRNMRPEKMDRESRVLRFIYLNRNCFNGIYRLNVQGQFNVPIGDRPGAYFTRSELRQCALLLKKARLVNGDFVNTLSGLQHGDFVYLDPPFALNSRRLFSQYTSKSFSTDDVPRFADALQGIARSKAHFVVSYADCREARRLASVWNSIRLPIRRHVAGFAGSRRLAYEWLISNIEIPQCVLSEQRKGRTHGQGT